MFSSFPPSSQDPDTDPILDSLVAEEQDPEPLAEDLGEYANEGGSGWNFEAQQPPTFGYESEDPQYSSETFSSVILEGETTGVLTPASNLSAQGSMENIPESDPAGAKKKSLSSYFFLPKKDLTQEDKKLTAEERRKSGSDQKRKEKREQV